MHSSYGDRPVTGEEPLECYHVVFLMHKECPVQRKVYKAHPGRNWLFSAQRQRRF